MGRGVFFQWMLPRCICFSRCSIIHIFVQVDDAGLSVPCRQARNDSLAFGCSNFIDCRLPSVPASPDAMALSTGDRFRDRYHVFPAPSPRIPVFFSQLRRLNPIQTNPNSLRKLDRTLLTSLACYLIKSVKKRNVS